MDVCLKNCFVVEKAGFICVGVLYSLSDIALQRQGCNNEVQSIMHIMSHTMVCVHIVHGLENTGQIIKLLSAVTNDVLILEQESRAPHLAACTNPVVVGQNSEPF